MTTLYGPHIPYKDNAYKGLKPKEEYLNWLEVERWAARLAEQVGTTFTWNASLRHGGGGYGSGHGVNLASGTTSSSLTTNADGIETFHYISLADDFYDDGTSTVLVVPRDGVYSISASVVCYSADTGLVGDVVSVVIRTGGYSCRMTDTETLFSWDPGTGAIAFCYVEPSTAGVPLSAGTHIYLEGNNYTAGTVVYTVDHFSATYEAELGTWNEPTPS